MGYSLMVGVRSVGDWIGDRFEIFDVHEGGMSLVYVVHDHLGKSGRTVVALKTLKDELLRHKIRRSRFATECRLWVQLGQHPNIVQAYAVEIIEGKPYVVLELVQGGDLVRWIGSRRLNLVQSLRFGVQFCQGMEHATRQGLSCHRDIKPGNLLITEDGVLKITDFGLARICEEMVAFRPELADGTIPLADAPKSPQRIIFTDPRDQEVRPIGFANPEATRTVRPSAQENAGAQANAASARSTPKTLGPPVPATKNGPIGVAVPTPTTMEKGKRDLGIRPAGREGRSPPDPVGRQAWHRRLHVSRAVPRSRIGGLSCRHLRLWRRSLRDDHGQAAVSGQVAGHARPPAFPLRAPLHRPVHTSFSCAWPAASIRSSSVA